MAGIVARTFFYPSLAYNAVMAKLGFRKWYTRLDDTVILGALPFRSMTEKLANDENVKGVIALNEPFELRHFYNSDDEWARLGVRVLKIPTRDFVGVPPLADIARALLFVDEIRSDNGSVYVHCKAGRTRSAIIAACYLVKTRGIRPMEAISFIKRRRSHIRLYERHRDAINKFYEWMILNAQQGLFVPPQKNKVTAD